MSRKKATVMPFKIKNKFEESVKIFDSKGADPRLSEFDTKPLFGGLSIYFPKNNNGIHQAPKGNIPKFFQTNIEWIKSQKVDFSTMEASSLI